MDLRAYHNALNQGFSESEASRIGDDAWENNRHQPTCEPEPEPDYYDVLAAENTQLRAELAKADGQINRCVEQNKYLESTISRLREYIRHKPLCIRNSTLWQINNHRCDCGYDDLIKEIGE